MNLLVLKFTKSDHHIVNGWPLCMCVCVCVSAISIAQKQINSRTFKCHIFYIYIIFRCYFKVFMRISQKLSVQGQVNEFFFLFFFFQPIDRISYYFILVYFNCIQYSEINIQFCYAQKCVVKIIWYEYHS